MVVSYHATAQWITEYENNSVGAGLGPITSKNAAQAIAAIQPIPWFEHVYGSNQGANSFLNWAQTGLGPGVSKPDKRDDVSGRPSRRSP